MDGKPAAGLVTWLDLTVEDAPRLRDFYQAVVGWSPETINMGPHSDYTMTANGQQVAGICHARGENAHLPPVWMLYITVTDLYSSLDECTRLGGQLLTPVRSSGGGRYCVIKDPAGAICALYQPPTAA